MNGDQGVQMPGQQYNPDHNSGPADFQAAAPVAAPSPSPNPNTGIAPAQEAPVDLSQQTSPAQQPMPAAQQTALPPQPEQPQELPAQNPPATQTVNTEDEGSLYKEGVVPGKLASRKTAAQWTAGGDILRSHAMAWRLRMIGLALVLSILIFFITSGDLFATGSVVVAGVLFGLLGSRSSQKLNYSIDSQGVNIGQRLYAFNEFRAFSVVDDRNSASIELIPFKRFMPAMLLRLDSAQEQQVTEVVEVLSNYLPVQQHHRDFWDFIVEKIKI